MVANEIRALSDKDLAEELDKRRLELCNVRFQHRMGRLPDTNALLDLKRQIARLLTVQREREIWAAYEAAQTTAGKE
jgi:large subunit ribosomal protein L29